MLVGVSVCMKEQAVAILHLLPGDCGSGEQCWKDTKLLHTLPARVCICVYMSEFLNVYHLSIYTYAFSWFLCSMRICVYISLSGLELLFACVGHPL